MKYIIVILTILIPNIVMAENSFLDQIKLNSIGYRWTQGLEGKVHGSKARLFTTFKVKKNHKFKFAWEMGKLNSPTDMFSGVRRADAIMAEYEYKFD